MMVFLISWLDPYGVQRALHAKPSVLPANRGCSQTMENHGIDLASGGRCVESHPVFNLFDNGVIGGSEEQKATRDRNSKG